MKWFEIVEDGGDGSSCVHRFRTKEEAEVYLEENEEWCRDGVDRVDTESSYFFD